MTELDARSGRVGPGRRALLLGAGATAGTLLLGQGTASAGTASAGIAGPAAAHGCAAATRWLDASYDVVAAQGLTPPTAARTYAGVCIAAYEALLGGMPLHRTLQGQLTGLGGLPAPAAGLHWPSVLGSAAAAVLRGLLPALSATGGQVLREAERRDDEDARSAGVPPRRLALSRAHGAAVARGVLAWFATDGSAQAGARPYTPPVGPGLWVPTPPNFGTAIEPHCAELRPMVLRTTDEVAPVAPVPFSTVAGSPFWREASTTYEQSRRNGDEERDLARFWTDNPLFSGLPAGHWLQIVVQVAEQRQLRLDATVEALARTAVTLHDAFLNCWTHKYRYNLLRPVTYVQAHLDGAWTTWVNTPQFPEHTSGHSVASRAASTVLTDLLGTGAFDDTARSTTVGITRRTRRWADFTTAADAAAQSRLYGGIHFPHGIEAGKAQGDAVGRLVIARLRTRRSRLR